MKVKKLKMFLVAIATTLFSMGTFSAFAERGGGDNQVVDDNASLQEDDSSQEEEDLSQREKKIMELKDQLLNSNLLLKDLGDSALNKLDEIAKLDKEQLHMSNENAKFFEKKNEKLKLLVKKLDNLKESALSNAKIKNIINEKIEELYENFNNNNGDTIEEFDKKLSYLRNILNLEEKNFNEVKEKFLEEEENVLNFEINKILEEMDFKQDAYSNKTEDIKIKEKVIRDEYEEKLEQIDLRKRKNKKLEKLIFDYKKC